LSEKAKRQLKRALFWYCLYQLFYLADDIVNRPGKMASFDPQYSQQVRKSRFHSNCITDLDESFTKSLEKSL